MTSFFALLRLQLLTRFADLKPRNLKAQLHEKKGRTIGMLCLYVFLIAYLGGILIFVENTLLDVLLGMGMPDMLLSMGVTMIMMGTLIMSFFFIMSALYFGRDAAFIASLPVKPRTVLSAKLVQVWISEVGFSLLLLLPACVLYGVKVGPEPLFYVRSLLVALGAPVLPIVIVAFLSTVLIRASALWKRKDLIATVGGVVFIAAYMFLAMNIGGVSGSGESEEILRQFVQSNTARIDSITHLFPPAAWAAKGLLGDWGQLLLFLAVCAGGMGLAVWAIGFPYQKLSLLQGEISAESGKKAKGSQRASFSSGSAFKANCLREFKQILRVPSYATNLLPIAFMPALMVAMIFLFIQRSGDGGDSMQAMLESAPPELVLAILTGVMAYLAGMNPVLSTAVSREGKGHDFMNALPVTPRTLILAKFAVGYGLSLGGVLLASVVLAAFIPAFATEAAMAFVLCALYAYLCDCLSLSRDVKKPRLDWVTEQEAVKQHFGVLIGMLAGWAILGLLALATFFLLSWGVSVLPYFAIMAAVLGIGCVVAHHMLMKTTDRYYCQG